MKTAGAAKVCRNCHEIKNTLRKGLCPACWRHLDRQRGTKTSRGYGATVHKTPLGVMTFDQYRRAAIKQVNPICWRCRKPIQGVAHVGHHDTDRTIIMGLEHPSCNLSAAGKSAHNP